jgi:hypothetical protein
MPARIEKADGSRIRGPVRTLTGRAESLAEYARSVAVASNNGDQVAPVLLHLKEDRLAVR